MSKERKKGILEDIQVAKVNLIEVKDTGIPQLRENIDTFEAKIVEEMDKLEKAEKLIEALPDSQVSNPSPALDSSLNSGSYLAKSARQHSEYTKNKFFTYLRVNDSLLGTAIVSNTSSAMVLDVAESAANLVAPQYPPIKLVIQEQRLPSPHEKRKQLRFELEILDLRSVATLEGAFQTLRDTSKQDRYRQAAHSMRDLITNLLNLLAPPEEVIKAVWFKPEKNTKGPTRAQRVKYAILGTQSKKVIDDEDLKEIDKLIQDTVNVYHDLSSFHSNDVVNDQEISILTESYMNRCVDLIYSLIELRKRFFT